MSINTSLQLKQQQKLIMTPKLLQRIQILQMPIQELATEVQKQLQENPVVELVEAKTDFTDPSEAKAADERQSEAPENNELLGSGEKAPAEQVPDSEPSAEYEKELETIDLKSGNNEIDWEQYYDDLEKTTHREEKEFEWHEQPSFENFVSMEQTLAGHLLEQLKAAVFSERELKIGELIIGHIDGAGYLKTPLEEIVKHPDIAGDAITAAEAGDVLETIQSFDPTGVGARSVRECLLIQYQALDELEKDPMLERLLANHLEDISEKRYKNIAATLGIEIEDVQEWVDYIVSNFNPKPGLSFASGDGNFSVTPEVFIEKIDGEYVVSVNDYGIPRIKINPRYEVLMRSKTASREVMDFIKENLEKARFILKSIEQRKTTIKRVVECIVSHQFDFFEHGVSHFKPLVLNEVAMEVGLDESTVSRVTSGKYAQTPRGVFELKYFFSTGLHSSTGEDVSTRSVKELIRNMIMAEPASKPLSDQFIVEELGKKGIQIARRTVTKYREEMKIPSSSKRKRFS